ncbi:dapper homolog 2-like [Narcine bancroftii]|uniref:dapper homolog 2-like n=1 Tax=Narcine bancroftii TaxID=1343680 RepID=UPI003831CCB0
MILTSGTWSVGPQLGGTQARLGPRVSPRDGASQWAASCPILCAAVSPESERRAELSLMARKEATGAPKAGLDRRRVGERLEASVAGLQELRLLRERHEETVRRLLREAGGDGRRSPAALKAPAGAGIRQGPSLTSGELGRIPLQAGFELGDLREACPADSSLAREMGPLSDAPSCEELSGELWRDDRGEQAGGRAAVVSPRLELGSNTRLAERAHDNDDSDSRPSSGFYDVSDGTSSSLSTSCPSVYSEGPGGSLWSVHSSCQLPWLGTGRSRPRSTDDGRPTELDMRAPEGEVCWANRRGKVSQRPVSAGELTLLRCYCGNTRTPSSCSSSTRPEPRFRCDLVSRNGGETYRYPSPLHAVALQSPLFTSSSPQPKEEDSSSMPREANPARPKACQQARRERLDRYICGLVMRLRCGHSAANFPSLSGGWKGRPGGPDRSGPQEEGRIPSPSASEGSQWPVPPEEREEEDSAPLYRGRHLNRQLVRCPEAGERAGQGRRGELLKQLSGGRKSAASRCRSETNLASASLHMPGFEPDPGAVSARRRQKWASVLEIPAPGWPRKAGLLSQAQAFLGRHQRPPSSSNSLPPPLRGAETLPRLAPVSEGRFHRSKSFRELRRKVQLSFRPWPLKAK